MFRVADSAQKILERVRDIAKKWGVEVESLGTNEPVILSSKPYLVILNKDFIVGILGNGPTENFLRRKSRKNIEISRTFHQNVVQNLEFFHELFNFSEGSKPLSPSN